MTAAPVWLLCHQLGYASHIRQLGRRPLPVRLAIAGTGLLTLVILTAFAGYPRSMVGEVGDAESNIFPTNSHRRPRGLPPRTVGPASRAGRPLAGARLVLVARPTLVLFAPVAIFARVEIRARRPRRTAPTADE